jgi:hypothetical protein
MSRAHNKRRNSGLLYEFLVRTISSALVEGDKKKSSSALKILKKYYKPGTELYREFRLINALVRTTVSSESVASNILNEARSASKEYSSSLLDKEKSHLIKSINYTFNNPDFYNQFVNEYKAYATAQTLINEWRMSPEERNISETAHFEDQMIRWLLSEKTQPQDSVLSEDSSGSSKMLVSVMTKKLNEKYSVILTENQKDLIRAYALSKTQEKPIYLRNKLHEIKTKLISDSEKYSQNLDSYTSSKINEVKEIVRSEKLDEINDDTVTRFMLYTKLLSEINSEE